MILTTTPEYTKRLIVLLPESLTNNLELAGKIYEMASAAHHSVFYLALVEDFDRTLSISRSVATMNALTSGNRIQVHSKLTKSSDWMKSLREVYRPGDKIICYDEQSVRNGSLEAVPMQEYLRERFGAPVIAISGFYKPRRQHLMSWLSSLFTWIGFLAILALFTFLQIQVEGALVGFSQQVVIILLLIVEIFAVWAWNSVRSW